MNRLVIIGNGFDLAHGLPTSYKDFIDDYWKTACDTKGLKTIKHNSNLVDIDCEFGGMYNTFDYEAIDNLNSYDELKKFVDRNKQKSSGNFLINFKNSFFKKICEKNSVQNWVDIENAYYKLLKESLTRGSSIIELNKQFDEVKSLLKKYLSEKVEKEYDFKNLNDNLIQIISDKKYTRTILNEFLKEISFGGINKLKENYQSHMQKTTGYGGQYKVPDLSIYNNFISFNYTSTMNSYLDYLNIETEFLNEIHGSIADESNPINFGFGDEMDEDYKLIENINDNEYLRNIKSFQYLHTSNYKRLLDLIESEVYQVYIMGHSCGLSDRTLLNTIFEHENCCSIKIFYHQKEDGSDNYTEITQNISRHFNDKKLMREKIVNKTFCQPLPQIQLPKKQSS